MKSNYLPELLYGTIVQMMKEPKFYYTGYNSDYSKWTDEGQQALNKFLHDVRPLIENQYREELDRRAKELVLEQLKKSN